MNVIVNIKKPIYGNYVYIRDIYVDMAINRHTGLEIIIPAGRAVVDPAKWKAEGKVMKKVFNYVDRPMILYGGYVPIPGVTKPIKKEKKKAEFLPQIHNLSECKKCGGHIMTGFKKICECKSEEKIDNKQMELPLYPQDDLTKS